MKKLMVALSAVALAFGVHAAESWFSGTGFEGVTAPVPLADNQSAGELDSQTPGSWKIPTLGEGESLTITAGDTGLVGDAVPEKFSQTTSLNYLDIHTKLGNPVERNINEGGKPQDITANGIYFDSLVKITACDTVPEADYQTDAKLLVYALENEDTGATNLFIRAGQIQADNTVKAVDYDCGEFTYVGQWVRLTIKAINNIIDGDDVCPGFVVFFGGNNLTGVNPKTCSTSKNLSTTIKFTAEAAPFGNALFPAYVESLSGASNSMLTSVAFDGQGAVDDIVFNDAAPFQQAQDKKFVTLAWADGVTGFTCSYDSVDYSKSGLTGEGSVDIVFNPGITSLEVTEITYADGKFGDSSKTFDPIEAKGKYNLTVKDLKATVEIGGVVTNCADLATAIELIEGASANAKLTLGADAGAIAIDRAAAVDQITVTIDLAGKTITPAEEAYGIFVDGAALVVTDTTTPVGTVNSGTDGSVASTVDAVLSAGIFKGAAGNVSAVVNGVKGDEAAKDSIDCLTDDQQWSDKDADNLYTVIEKVTFTVTWDDSAANATAEATVDGDEINPGDAFPANTVVEFTVTPDEDFEYATEPTDWKLEEDGTITKTVTVVDQNLTVEIPVATEKTYAVTWDDTDANAKAVAKVYGLPIENGQKFARNTDVAFTVTPDENYEYATAPEGWTLEEDGTITQIFTVEDKALDVEIPVATAKQQGWPEDPTDWNGKKASEKIPGIPAELENADAGTIAKWATTEGNVDFKVATGIVTDAFLLNIDNASTPEEIQEAKDAFKITAITIGSDGTVTITGPDEADYNGKVTIEGKKTLDATWGPKADDDKFFRATLTVKEIAE